MNKISRRLFGKSAAVSAAAAASGRYSIGLSNAAWIDVVQNNRFLESRAHSGALECQGIRKVVQFDLSSGPFVVQISGATAPRLSIAIMPAE